MFCPSRRNGVQPGIMLFCFFHIAFHIKAGHFSLAVATDGDRLLEMAGELARTIIFHLDLTLLTRFDRLLGKSRYGASTAC